MVAFFFKSSLIKIKSFFSNNLMSTGACVEPMRILLVTDYCAKGSLYDIIENEDIKLDNLFIASLINDLIKVRVSYNE